MDFPQLSEALRLERLIIPDGQLRMVLDTDTYNEVDDQFAVVHALLAPERLKLEAIYAAPYFNNRSASPADGMEKSYEEIIRLLERLNISDHSRVFRGSTDYLRSYDAPYRTEAALDLVERAMSSDDVLYVVAIGAITNVASALLIEPRIIERIVVVWLGGNALHWPHTNEFNLKQDMLASRLIFDCGVPLIQIPCAGVTTLLRTTVPEIERYVAGQGAIGDYLAETLKGYHEDHTAWSKEIWDLVTTAYLVNPASVTTYLVASPVLNDGLTWSVDSSRHFIRYAYTLNRDVIFKDFFRRLAAWNAGEIQIDF